MDLKHARRRRPCRSRSARSGSGATAPSPGSRAPPATSPSGSASSASCASREERYRFLVENSPDVVFSTDVEGNFTFVSETIEQMTGFSPAELVGGHFSQIVDERRCRPRSSAGTPLVAEPDRTQVVRARPHPPRRRDRAGRGQLARDDSSTARSPASTASTRDISERERLERDLRRQAGELASSQERAHLARELHDSVTQALFSMTLVTRTTELLVDRDADEAKVQLGSLRDLQREALAEMRALIFELRPGNIEQDGLLPALRDPHRRAPGPDRPADRRHERPQRTACRWTLEEVLYRISPGGAPQRRQARRRPPGDALDRQGPGRPPAPDRRRRQGLRRRRASRTATSASPGCGPGPRRSGRRSRSTRGPARGRRSRSSCRTTAIDGRARRVAGRRRSRCRPVNARHRRNDVGDLHTGVSSGIGVACPTLAA